VFRAGVKIGIRQQLEISLRPVPSIGEKRGDQQDGSARRASGQHIPAAMEQQGDRREREQVNLDGANGEQQPGCEILASAHGLDRQRRRQQCEHQVLAGEQRGEQRQAQAREDE
jgi:hypothetical protein